LPIFRDLDQGRLEPVVERFQMRTGPRLPHRRAGLWGLAPDLRLDRIERADALEHLGRQRTGVGLVKLVELAPDVRPTGDFMNATGVVQPVEPGIAICLQGACKVCRARAATPVTRN